jgi:hypothetical protein
MAYSTRRYGARIHIAFGRGEVEQQFSLLKGEIQLE